MEKCCEFMLAALLRFTGVQDGAYFVMRQTLSKAIGVVCQKSQRDDC